MLARGSRPDLRQRALLHAAGHSEEIPRTSTRIPRSRSSGGVSATANARCPPQALLNTASSRPMASIVRWTRRSTEAGSPTSVVSGSASPPACTISRAICSISRSLQAARTTFAPSWAKSRAVAAPMPRLAPLTIATLSSRRRPGLGAFCGSPFAASLPCAWTISYFCSSSVAGSNHARPLRLACRSERDENTRR